MVLTAGRAMVRKMAKEGTAQDVFTNTTQAVKNSTWGQRIDVAGAGFAGISGYNQARDEGQGVVGSLAKGTTDAFLINLIGWKKYLAGAALIETPKMLVKGYESMSVKAREMERAGSSSPFSNNTFVDTEQTYTMRQAGLSMIEGSSYNTKTAVLGNEAQLMHR